MDGAHVERPGFAKLNMVRRAAAGHISQELRVKKNQLCRKFTLATKTLNEEQFHHLIAALEAFCEEHGL